MRSLFSTLVVFGIVALPAVLPAQEKSSVLSPAELASRRESVANLESHIAGREKRMGEIVTDIRALDDRIEDGVNEIVLMLGGMKDSETSKVKIANTKADVIVGLKRTIDYYKKHRDLLREQLRTGKSALPRETLEKDLAIFDGRIEKRVQQIMELAKSFPDPQELEKYEVTSTSSWFGWSNENVEISEAWKQNRRDERHTEEAREGVSKGLRDSIENLRKRNAYLSEKIKSPNTSETERSYYETEIGQNAVLLEERNRQLEEFSTGDATTTFAVDQGKAHDVDQLVRSEREDLREDFFSLFRKYDELNRARGELKQLQDNLAARKEWLSKYDAEHAK